MLKTDAGTVVSAVRFAALMGEKLEEPVLVVPPLATLMITRAATTMTTSPTASHVKSPAGRPPRAFTGGRVVLGRFFCAEVLATMLLFGRVRIKLSGQRTNATASEVSR